MTVTVREKSAGKHTVDIRIRWTDLSVYRERPVVSGTPTQAKRWGEQRERELLAKGQPKPQQKVVRRKVDTLDTFTPKFLEWAHGERQKASTINSKKSIVRLYLSPLFGSEALDQIHDQHIARLKGDLAAKKLSRKTTNCVLTVLSKLLKVAVELRVIQSMPCTIKLLKDKLGTKISFYDFGDYARLVEGATKVGRRELVLVLLGGDAGLRRGEMIGLRWSDLDFTRGLVHVEQAAWKATMDTPKSGGGRVIPMTVALKAALTAHRHLRGERVLCLDDGSPAPGHILRDWLESAQRRAGLHVMGSLHKLRHTFCSHLAMRGAPAKAIQELAGHESLSTTLRYMHLSPSARDAAIDLLNDRGTGLSVQSAIAESSLKQG